MVMRIRAIFGYPPRSLYDRFLLVDQILREEVELALYTLSCVRLCARVKEFPQEMIDYFNHCPHMRKVVLKARHSERYQWCCQGSHRSLKPATFVEALLADGQVEI